MEWQGETHQLGGPYYDLDGEYLTTNQIQNLVTSGEILALELLSPPNSLNGPYYNINGVYTFLNENLQQEATSYTDGEELALKVGRQNAILVNLPGQGWAGVCMTE